ncbi:hypothetical protein CAPI_05850 [Corynebacterium capitovis DSM 44611]|uniref:putative cytokinetic ring protein SteA n=1 Tax=Corynebacterium capitovis TaxID=131081 RepID=UPI0003A6C4C9|nr:putative cytokinetic ring protein SteA [Corynebacterium capitovis]WKD57718.1 hypothetical protein CAPI_05850 [Corynebacterium capitovis DSM 44611]
MSVFPTDPDARIADAKIAEGALRDCTPRGRSSGVVGRLGRFSEGDIAVVDSPELTRRETEALISARPGAVVNLAAFTTGGLPSYGPLLLLDAGIPLIEDAGGALRSALRGGRFGKKATVTGDGGVTVGKKLVAQGRIVDRAAVDAAFAESQRALLDHMEAYFGNTIEFIHSEAPLLIDGVGVPDIGNDMEGRKVLIASPEPTTRDKLLGLRNFIREYSPVIVGVGAAADTLADLGYRPDFIVGDPLDVSAENLRGESRVILPADPDGYAVGLERIQDLGVGAMTFPAATDSPLDLAIMLAAFHGAEMVVTAAPDIDLDRILAHSAEATPAALLTRLKAAPRLVDSSVIANLYEVNSGSSVAWAWAILGVLVALAVVVLIVGLGGDQAFVDNLIHTWNNIALSFQGWVRGLFN